MKQGHGQALPLLRFELRPQVSAVRAAILGYGAGPFVLPLILTNVMFHPEKNLLLPNGDGPVIGISPLYQRLLQSLWPPSLAAYHLCEARQKGVPTLVFPRSLLFGRGLCIEPIGDVKNVVYNDDMMRQSYLWLQELNRAWGNIHPDCTLEIGWRVFIRSKRQLSVLDAVGYTVLQDLPKPQVFKT